MSKVYITSKSGNTPQIRAAALAARNGGFKVFDRTDPRCLGEDTLKSTEATVEAMKAGLESSDAFILVLPSDELSSCELTYALAKGIPTVTLGAIDEKENSFYLLSDLITEDLEEAISWIQGEVFTPSLGR